MWRKSCLYADKFTRLQKMLIVWVGSLGYLFSEVWMERRTTIDYIELIPEVGKPYLWCSLTGIWLSALDKNKNKKWFWLRWHIDDSWVRFGYNLALRDSSSLIIDKGWILFLENSLKLLFFYKPGGSLKLWVSLWLFFLFLVFFF